MPAHTSPDDVRSGGAAGTVLERGTPIGSPGHLEDGVRAIHALDAQPGAEPTGGEVGDESSAAAPTKPSLVIRRQMLPVAVEPDCPFPGRHLSE